ncbi:MAG: phospho-N-acetylmuramoyl-pentapeptide-transferase [Clostridiales bacterium]|nr:phospho-N-acetylmuramoyl-pentapeptide-transferase [Clostridiales bacterium]MDD7036055.1 phospho-N-acetylmuramoyl-pentapeptide-transferase [Bacillota bacterium]MDY2920859.1 phospho-N-acetylmuramoyl-pentapeptide-transferase [Lentihominibacter sp.]
MDIVYLLVTIGVAFAIAAIITKFEIPVLREKAGQNIREEGLKSHYSKAGTPSMGGISIIVSACVTSAVATAVLGCSWKSVVVIIIVFAGFGLIGFIDDYLKVIKKQNEGLKAGQKFALQFIIALVFAIIISRFSYYGTQVFIPVANVYVDFGFWYYIFVVFAVLAMTNAVNLTDGLDGLASGVTVPVCLFFALAALIGGSHLPVAAGGTCAEELFFASVCGACLGFLVYNRNPARVFMGDTGSLALGGGLAAAAVMMHMELFLIVAGLLYVIEALSVVLQVGYFKLTGGKRLFRMAPIHHHFEKCGMGERSVVAMFCGFTILCCAAAMLMVIL